MGILIFSIVVLQPLISNTEIEEVEEIEYEFVHQFDTDKKLNLEESVLADLNVTTYNNTTHILNYTIDLSKPYKDSAFHKLFILYSILQVDRKFST